MHYLWAVLAFGWQAILRDSHLENKTKRLTPGDALIYMVLTSKVKHFFAALFKTGNMS